MNDKILAPIKQRILLLIDYKGVKKMDFYNKIEVAASNFRGNALYSEVGGDVIAKILSFFPDVSPDWLILGIGDMLRTGPANYIEVKNLCKEELIESLKKTIQTQEMLIEALRRELDILQRHAEDVGLSDVG